MTVTQLECFLAIARTRSFGRAAEQLAKTQPALSVQIQRLEADLGVTLLERTGREVGLTGAGEILVPHAERIVVEVQHSRTKMLDVKGGVLGSCGSGCFRRSRRISCLRCCGRSGRKIQA